MSNKSEKIQSHKKKDDKKPVEGKKYALISHESIISIAEASGIEGLNEDVAKQLAEDVSYRLLEMIHNCKVQLRHSKQVQLTSSIVNDVFNIADVPTVYGHSNKESLNFSYIKDAEVYVTDESEIDVVEFALSNKSYVQNGEPFVHGSWHNIDIQTPNTNSQIIVKEENKPTTSSLEKKLNIPPNILKLYHHFSTIILSKSENLLKVVLGDLQSNNKINLIVPYLINLLALGLQELPRPNAPKFFRCVNALLLNSNINPSGCNPVTRLLFTLLTCVLDPQLRQGMVPSQDYELRAQAAAILSRVVSTWCVSENKLHLEILQKLGSVLLNGSGSLRSHYGALVTLCSLGTDALDYCLWPHFPQYMEFIEMQSTQAPLEIIQVKGALLMAAELMYRQVYGNFSSEDFPLRPAFQNMIVLDKLLYHHFGDTLCVRRMFDSLTTSSVKPWRTKSADADEGSTSNVHSNDYELDYRKWTAISCIPSNLLTFIYDGKAGLSINLPEEPSSTRSWSLTDVFEDIDAVRKRLNECVIKVNVRGRTSRPISELRRKKLLSKRFTATSDYYKKTRMLKCVGKLMGQSQLLKKKICLSHILNVI